MRLDHLLSKEHERKFKSFGQQGRASRKKALFNFEDTQGERVSAKKKLEKPRETRTWGCSSAGRAPALQAGGQEFDPPHLHQTGRIAQVVRAHA